MDDNDDSDDSDVIVIGVWTWIESTHESQASKLVLHLSGRAICAEIRSGHSASQKSNNMQTMSTSSFWFCFLLSLPPIVTIMMMSNLLKRRCTKKETQRERAPSYGSLKAREIWMWFLKCSIKGRPPRRPLTMGFGTNATARLICCWLFPRLHFPTHTIFCSHDGSSHRAQQKPM